MLFRSYRCVLGNSKIKAVCETYENCVLGKSKFKAVCGTSENCVLGNSKIKAVCETSENCVLGKLKIKTVCGTFQRKNWAGTAARGRLPLQDGQKLPQMPCNSSLPGLVKKKFPVRSQKGDLPGITSSLSDFQSGWAEFRSKSALANPAPLQVHAP